MLYHPFCAFADFECFTRKITTTLPDIATSSFTTAIEEHIPASYTLIVLNKEKKIIFHEFYVGEYVIDNFLRTLKEISDKLIKKMKKIIPIDGDVRQYNSEVCRICKQRFLENEIRVRDHDHYLQGNNFLGLAHQSCNLNLSIRYFLPVIIHNARNYDSHLILKDMPHDIVRTINIIPMNMEKITMFTLDNIKILDSFQFLNQSLDSLVESLKSSGHEFQIFEDFYGKCKHRNLLKRKGIFPYSYFDDLDKLNETQLPPREKFYNILNNSDISEKDYLHALTVFKKFKCKNLRSYLELYQNVDTLMLAEFFTKFRETSFQSYELDPVHFVTSAELTWHAGLKMTKVELQLLGDVNMYLWLERQIRGGICTPGARRHVIANNPYLGDDYYDPRKPTNYIICLDVANLYGAIMHDYFLPLGDFYWLSEAEVQSFKILEMASDSPVGFFIEFDAIYPKSCHSVQNDLPLAVEKLLIKEEMLSPYTLELLKKYNLSKTLPTIKLTPNFFNKKNYVAHYLNLKFYVQNGLVITKIHRILAFAQSAWLAPYVEFNNAKRQEAVCKTQKDFYKCMNNSFFGRSMMNPRKRVGIKAAISATDCQRHLSNPLMEYFDIINENLVLFKMKKKLLTLDKPIFVGFSVLELSKLKMYSLYYNNFKRVYGHNCSLAYTDTDSLFLDVTCEDVFLDLKNIFSDIMDLSNFDKNHIAYDVTNKGKMGYLKVEVLSPVKEFIALKSKMYMIESIIGQKKKAKGIKKSVVENEININDYRNVLYKEIFLRHFQTNILSKNHMVQTVSQNRIGLSPYFDKKFVLSDGITLNSYGHYENENLL